MAAYDYYRSSVPGWGTSQFQFVPPPMPTFQPQPTWTGFDFYNAHAMNPDPMFYNNIMGRINSYSGLGVDHGTARHWHSLVYSGMTPLTQLLPADVGAAAAYEVYRTWKHNSSLYSPLSADRMMQREGLIGMAIAEATRLWQYAGRSMDTYGQRAACESAAATAAILADRFTSLLGGGTNVFPPSPVPSPYYSGAALPGMSTSYPGSYPGSYASASPAPISYVSSHRSHRSRSPSVIPAPAGSTVVLTRPRHRSYSRDRSGHHHHHHHDHGRHHRSSSVEIVQTGGGGGGYGYAPYGGGGGGGGYYGGGGYGGYGEGYGGHGGGYGGQYPYNTPSGCVIC
ncbi:hypothetical protein C8Q74DRAFT_755697 [Fomes fomentarius]|nr:hypothetical protein C8Q74DRAFT_755697 [Fomes fomentarius]